MDHKKLLDEMYEVNDQVFRKMIKYWGTHVEKGISRSQSLVLQFLAQKGCIKASELAELLGITSGAVTSLSDKLIQSGYARRIRDNEDRRVVYLEITDQGHEILDFILKRRKEVAELFYGHLSDEDIRHLIRIYGQVLHAVDHNFE